MGIVIRKIRRLLQQECCACIAIMESAEGIQLIRKSNLGCFICIFCGFLQKGSDSLVRYCEQNVTAAVTQKDQTSLGRRGILSVIYGGFCH